MSLTLALFGALGAGPAAGLHFFVMIVAVVPLAMWPSRRLLLAFYFALNSVLFLAVELAPLGEPWVRFSAAEATLVRTASILCTFGSITGILVGQAWFADRHRVQLRRRTHALSVTRDELRAALATVQTLEGIIPICMFCKKTRDDAGYWQAVERFIEQRTQAGVQSRHLPRVHGAALPRPGLINRGRGSGGAETRGARSASYGPVVQTDRPSAQFSDLRRPGRQLRPLAH